MKEEASCWILSTLGKYHHLCHPVFVCHCVFVCVCVYEKVCAPYSLSKLLWKLPSVNMSQLCEIEQSTSGSISCPVNRPEQIEMRFTNLDAGINKTEYDRLSISPRAVLGTLQTGLESIVLLHFTKDKV